MAHFRIATVERQLHDQLAAFFSRNISFIAHPSANAPNVADVCVGTTVNIPEEGMTA